MDRASPGSSYQPAKSPRSGLTRGIVPAEKRGDRVMRQGAQEGLVDEGLSRSLLGVVSTEESVAQLRCLLSGFTHRCRNSLNGLKMSMYLYRRLSSETLPSTWSEIERTYQTIELVFDRLHALYRPMSLTLVQSPLGPLIAEHELTWQDWLHRTGKSLQVLPPAVDPPGQYDPPYLGQSLDALAEWRSTASQSGTRVQVSWSQNQEGWFEFDWVEEPGASVSNGRRPHLDFERESVSHAATSGVDLMSLPLLVRIISVHGGGVEAITGRGWGIRLTWPAQPTNQPDDPPRR